jgi:hypothetical protein
MYFLFSLSLFADIKGFLADVKPALLSALDAEYDKNPFEVMGS